MRTRTKWCVIAGSALLVAFCSASLLAAEDYGFLESSKLVQVDTGASTVKYRYLARTYNQARATAENARAELGYKTGWAYKYYPDGALFTNARTGESIRFYPFKWLGKGEPSYTTIERPSTARERLRAWLLRFSLEDDIRVIN